MAGQYSAPFTLLVTRSSMQAYDSSKDEWYCDLMCYVCDGWSRKPCLMGGTLSMRMIMAQCLGLRKFITEFAPTGKWAKFLSIAIPSSAPPPPVYRAGAVGETEH